MTPEHMAKAHAMLDCVADGPIAVAELLATQLAEVASLTLELADAHRDLAVVYGRNECGQRFPSLGQRVAAARRVAHRNGWADPYPEEPKL